MDALKISIYYVYSMKSPLDTNVPQKLFVKLRIISFKETRTCLNNHIFFLEGLNKIFFEILFFIDNNLTDFHQFEFRLLSFLRQEKFSSTWITYQVGLFSLWIGCRESDEWSSHLGKWLTPPADMKSCSRRGRSLWCLLPAWCITYLSTVDGSLSPH